MTSGPLPTWMFVDAAGEFGGHEVMLLRWLQTMAAVPGPVAPQLLARAGTRLWAQAPAALRGPAFAARGGLPAELRHLARCVRALRPECVVVASGALGAHVPHVLLLRALGVPVLLYVPLLGTFRAMGYRLGAWKDRFVRWGYARVPSGWVAITAAQAAEFRAWANPAGPVFVLPNTVAPAIEAAPPVPVRSLEPGEPLRVLVLGRLDAHQKGLDLLLDHLARLVAHQPAALTALQLTLVGDGPSRAHIEMLLSSRPRLAAHVALRPWMPAAEAIAGCDVLLLASRYEGVPLVMLEAMALGVPVVATDLPGLRPYLPAACLYPVGDIDAALDILHALRSAARRGALADAGRARFAAEASGQAFTHHVRQLVAGVRRVLAFDNGAAVPPHARVARTALDE